MSLTIDATHKVNSFKHLKALYIAAACGIAIAAAVAIVGATADTNPNRPPVASVPAAAANVSRDATPTKVFYFVVDSEANRIRMESVLASESYIQEMPVKTYVVVVNDLEQEAQLAATQRELAAIGTPFEVADLRTSAPAAAVNPGAASKSDLDAAIMGSVISTERATWLFDANGAPVVRKLSDADLMTSVISTESATWVMPEQK